jgi:anti-sigma factor RsiW
MSSHNGDHHSADIQPEQLTAFALGQLAGDEQAAVERWLAEPEQDQARQAVAEMRRLAEVLPGALSVGGSLKPSAGLREAVLQKLAEAEKVEPASKAIPTASRWPRAIQWAIVGGIACLVIGLAIPAIRTARESARRASQGDGRSKVVRQQFELNHAPTAVRSGRLHGIDRQLTSARIKAPPTRLGMIKMRRWFRRTLAAAGMRRASQRCQ